MIDPEESKWFIIYSGQITGPFSKVELDIRAEKLGEAMIWGRGQSEWLPYPRWVKGLTQFDAVAEVQSTEEQRLWFLRIHGQELDPLRYEDMMNLLRQQTDMSTVLVWTEGYSEWREVFQIHKIMDELGVSRRKQHRVPINGTLACESSSGSFESRVLSISEGGLGIADAPLVKIGDKFRCTLKSKSLSVAISSTVEVIYSGGNGYAGLKFIGLAQESRSLLVDYVKRAIQEDPSLIHPLTKLKQEPEDEKSSSGYTVTTISSKPLPES